MKTNEQHPFISIGIPTYNGKARLAAAIMSVLNQQYPNLEIIISDNCSTDETQNVCEDFFKKYPEIRYFRQPYNIGLVPNFEFVLKMAKGDYFMWLADDDRLEPGILKKYADFLYSHSEYVLVSGQIRYWLEEKPRFVEKKIIMESGLRSWRVIWFYFNVKYGGLFHGMMRRTLAMKIPMWRGIGTDWHFVAGLAFQGKVMNLDEVGYHKKLSGASGNFKQYARVIGASWISGQFPHVKLAVDALAVIALRSPIYKEVNLPSRWILAIISSAGILFNHYVMEVPFIIGGKVKRFWTGSGQNQEGGSLSQVKTPI